MATDFFGIPSHNHGPDEGPGLDCPEKTALGMCVLEDITKQKDDMIGALRILVQAFRRVDSFAAEERAKGAHIDPYVQKIVKETYENAAHDVEGIIDYFTLNDPKNFL